MSALSNCSRILYKRWPGEGGGVLGDAEYLRYREISESDLLPVVGSPILNWTLVVVCVWGKGVCVMPTTNCTYTGMFYLQSAIFNLGAQSLQHTCTFGGENPSLSPLISHSTLWPFTSVQHHWAIMADNVHFHRPAILSMVVHLQVHTASATAGFSQWKIHILIKIVLAIKVGQIKYMAENILFRFFTMILTQTTL